MPAALKSTSEGSTLILTLSNPEFRNALGPEIYAAGVEALNAAEDNPEIRSVVITGEGGVFCAGGNLQRLQANRQQPPEVQALSIDALHNWIDSIRTYPTPVIAAVEGAAAGAGFSLVLACELDWEAALVWVDDRFEYDELRMIALAPRTEILYCVAFVDRGEVRRVISLRRANRREVKHYVENV